MKKVVVGLGNPGSRYEKTRHNIGWLVLDRLAERRGAAGRVKARDGAASVRGRLGDAEVVLVKPTTYMNLSGAAVRKVLAREGAPLEDLLVVVDDMALPFGRLRLRERGSAGGHNGLRSVIGELGTEGFARLRIGIGAPKRAAIEHVLGDFEHAEQRELDTVLEAAADAVEEWALVGTPAAANRWNAWQPVGEPAEPPSEPAEPPGEPAGKTAEAELDTDRSPGPRATAPRPRPDADGIVRTSTGWRRLLPGRRQGQGADEPR